MTRTEVVEGIATAMRHCGAAGNPPVLGVHGFAADMSVWMLLEPALGTQVSLTLIDLPAHGASAAMVPEGGLSGFAAHLAGVMDISSPSSVWILAHSFGAAVALRAAALRRAQVAGLILIAPAGLGTPVNPDFVAELCAAPDARVTRTILGQMLARPTLVTPAMAEGVFAQVQDPRRGAALRQVADMLPGLDAALAPDLPHLADLPIHVIRGALDPIIAPDNPLPASLAMAKLHMIENAGHLPQLEAPRPTLAAIRAAIGLPQ